jgi:polar amino acid transport system substrate-binding protein
MSSMHPSRSVVAAFLFALLAAASLTAQDEPLVVVMDVWPPFRIADPASPSGLAGIDVEVLSGLGAETGFGFRIERHPWTRALQLLRSGDADLIMGIAHTDERAEYIRYVKTSYASVRPRLYIRAGGSVSIAAYEDLYECSIGQSPSTAYFEPYDSDRKLSKMTIASEERILQMLSLGRIDVAIGTEPNISWDIARLGYRGVLIPAGYQPPKDTKLYIGFSKKRRSQELADTIDAAVVRMRDRGVLEAIFQKYR